MVKCSVWSIRGLQESHVRGSWRLVHGHHDDSLLILALSLLKLLLFATITIIIMVSSITIIADFYCCYY